MKKLIIVIAGLLVINSGASAQDRELSLSYAISIAMENNFGLRISKSNTEIARINNNWANAGRLPTVGFDLANANNYIITDDNFASRLNAGIGLRWTIFDGFRVALTKDRLTQIERLAEGRTAVVIENTIEDVILGYYQVLLQQELLKVLGTVMHLSEDRYKYEKTRQEFGNTVTYNVLTAKNNYLSDKAAYINQEVNYRNAVRNLDFILGEDSQTTWIFTEAFEADTIDYLLSDMLEKMISDNSVLKNQYINIMLAKNNAELLKSNYYPSVSISAGLDNSTVFSPSSSKGNSFSTYGNITLSYDIYQGGLRAKALEVAKINESVSGIEEEELKRSLTNQLLNLVDQYNVQKELLYIAGENVEAARLNMQIAGDKFRTGAINSFNYRDIQLIYLNAAYQQIQDIYNLIATRTALTRLTGGFINTAE